VCLESELSENWPGCKEQQPKDVLGSVDEIEAANSPEFHKLQQGSTSARHLFETEGTENE
jgi:hypothetical protein